MRGFSAENRAFDRGSAVLTLLAVVALLPVALVAIWAGSMLVWAATRDRDQLVAGVVGTLLLTVPAAIGLGWSWRARRRGATIATQIRSWAFATALACIPVTMGALVLAARPF
jgi:uncharacterized membrane protein YqjE